MGAAARTGCRDRRRGPRLSRVFPSMQPEMFDMPAATAPTLDAYFVLAAWCTAEKAWHDMPGRHESPNDARDQARERGVYRLFYVRHGLRLDLDTWAVVGCD
jgi:hypothetical protein